MNWGNKASIQCTGDCTRSEGTIQDSTEGISQDVGGRSLAAFGVALAGDDCIAQQLCREPAGSA